MLLITLCMRFWMVLDIILDFHQTATYLKLKKDDKEEGIGIGFFVCCLLSLIIIPLCLYLALFFEILDVTQKAEVQPLKFYGYVLLAIPFSCILYYVLYVLAVVHGIFINAACNIFFSFMCPSQIATDSYY